MARPLRLLLQNGWYHVTARGNHRQRIYCDTRGQKWAEFAHRRGDWGLPLALYVARRCTGLSLRALADAAGGMDYKAVSMNIKRLEQRLAKDMPLVKLAQQLINERQT